MWCNPAAEYESMNSEVTEKHLAGTVVFTFTWTAWECLIDQLSAGGGKGAQGREIIASVGGGEMPYLDKALHAALKLDQQHVDFKHRDMRRMVSLGSKSGIAAEYLRQFRNRMIHGDISKPEPEDWGANTHYAVDEDPALRRFHANVRLLLLLLQIMARTIADDMELESWLDEPTDSCLFCLYENRKNEQ